MKRILLAVMAAGLLHVVVGVGSAEARRVRIVTPGGGRIVYRSAPRRSSSRVYVRSYNRGWNQGWNRGWNRGFYGPGWGYSPGWNRGRGVYIRF